MVISLVMVAIRWDFLMVTDTNVLFVKISICVIFVLVQIIKTQATQVNIKCLQFEKERKKKIKFNLKNKFFHLF
jgi:hypothetical protein